MENVSTGFILTIIAGLSTMIGTIPIFLKNKTDNIIISSLSFAAGVMLCVSLTDLLPESFSLIFKEKNMFLTIIYMLIFVNIGIIFTMLINRYFPGNVENKGKSNGLYRVGIISMLAIIFHNIPEGIATFMATTSNVSLGLSLAIAIALHNIPEGISISVPIYYATKNKFKAILYTLISGLSEPLGALLTYIFLSNFITDNVMGYLFSFIAGIMGYIAIFELLPTSKKYNNKFLTYLFFIIGMLFMYITHIIK